RHAGRTESTHCQFQGAQADPPDRAIAAQHHGQGTEKRTAHRIRRPLSARRSSTSFQQENRTNHDIFHARRRRSTGAPFAAAVPSRKNYLNMETIMKNAIRIAVRGAALAAAGAATAQDITLRASHQFPGGQGDPRDEMVQIIAREVAAANVGLKIQVFPGSSLYKATEQWGALTRGQLDMSAFPLDYASGRVPQFSATLMPGLVRNFDHALRLNK